MSFDLIPMLLLSLLLMTVGGDVGTVELVLGGDHETVAVDGLIIGDGDVTVPADAAIGGPVHLLGGDTRIAGTVDGDVTVLAGSLVVTDGARITGTLQHLGGLLAVEPGAVIGRRTTLDVTPADRGLVARILPVSLLAGLLCLAAARRARRRPRSLEHLRSAVEDHPVVSLTVGALVSVSFLSLFVFMAFTLVLLPVSILGLATGLVLVGYGIIALGTVIAARLPLHRPGAAAAAGVAVVVALLWLAGLVPLAGSLAVGALLLTGLGAVLLTYLGLKEFRPATIPESPVVRADRPPVPPR
jgi:cytoskeletal protein CcmA (bactofilin family)